MSSGADVESGSKHLQLLWNTGSTQTIPGVHPVKVDQPRVKSRRGSSAVNHKVSELSR